MRQSITTLPISPTEKPHLGLCLMPFFMDMLGKNLGLERVLSLNIQGLKYKLTSTQSEKIQLAQNYANSLNKLDIFPDHIWRDDLNEFMLFAQNVLTDLLKQDKLKIANRTVIKCPCGKVEYLKGATNLSLKRRLFAESVDGKNCKSCGGMLVEKNIPVCLYPMTVTCRNKIIPSSAETSFNNMMRAFSGVEYLVSKTRVTHFSLNLPGQEELGIDPDFLWSLMIPHLHSKGLPPKFVISSRKNLLASLSIAMVAESLGYSDTTFIFPPYLVGPNRTNVCDFGSVDSLIEQFGKSTVRAFLVSSLNWQSTEASARPEYLKYLGSLKPEVLELAMQKISPNDQKEIVKLDNLHFNKVLNCLRKEL